MVAAFILATSILALLQFGFSQWRLLWLTTANQPLTGALRSAIGIEGNAIGGKDFGALLVLCDELSPQIKKGTPWLRELKGYYRVVSKVEKWLGPLQPAIAAWAANEMTTCARFVAVVLDHNLTLDLDRQATARSV